MGGRRGIFVFKSLLGLLGFWSQLVRRSKDGSQTGPANLVFPAINLFVGPLSQPVNWRSKSSFVGRTGPSLGSMGPSLANV